MPSSKIDENIDLILYNSVNKKKTKITKYIVISFY